MSIGKAIKQVSTARYIKRPSSRNQLSHGIRLPATHPERQLRRSGRFEGMFGGNEIEKMAAGAPKYGIGIRQPGH
jgi:hypothetical protein